MDCINQEYETQFYGFNRTALVAEVKENIVDVLESVINDACAKLKTKYESSSVDEFEKKALEAYRSSIEQNTEALAEVTRKYFSFKPSILLPEDEIQQTQYSQKEERQLDEELAAAKKEFIALVVLEQKLKDHLDAQAMNIQMLDSMAALEEGVADLEIYPRIMQESVDKNFSISSIESIIDGNI